MNSLEDHLGLVEDYLGELRFAEELGELSDAMRYSLEGGGKRIRPLLCLASGEAMGAEPGGAAPRRQRRSSSFTRSGWSTTTCRRWTTTTSGQVAPTSHVQFDEATAILNGDALLAQAFELALSYSAARRRARALTGGTGDDRRPVRRRPWR